MSNKEKLIASAQKSLDKGQIARAIKDYQKIVELDPRDVRNRQKLAELYSRARMLEEALSAYEAVAKFYVDGGFFLKAIAVYKQMQKLDPGQTQIYQRLAELNEKQGLVGNALAEYRNLVAYYEKRKMVSETIGVLQKMKALEPGSLNIRVKVAENCVQAGLISDAKVEFEEILAILRQKDDYPRIAKFYEFFLSLCPDDIELQIGLADAFIHMGEADRGIQLIKSLLKEYPEHLELLKVLARGYRSQGDRENERRTYHHLLKLAPGDLDLKEDYLTSCLAAGEAGDVLAELEAWKESFLADERIAALKGFYERLKDLLPGEPTVVEALHDIYQRTGEGDKLFDLISSTSHAEGAEAPSRKNIAAAPLPPVSGGKEAEAPAGDDVSEEAQAFLSQFEESGVLSVDVETSSAGESPKAAPEELDLELELELELDDAGPAVSPEAADIEALDMQVLDHVEQGLLGDVDDTRRAHVGG